MIRFSEEQAMLLDTAREFCQKRAPIDAVRQAIQAGQPLDATLWQTMVDLGWLGGHHSGNLWWTRLGFSRHGPHF